eukprot:13454481-Heterocapsa_arctica.AAC.1
MRKRKEVKEQEDLKTTKKAKTGETNKEPKSGTIDKFFRAQSHSGYLYENFPLSQKNASIKEYVNTMAQCDPSSS